MYKVFFNKSLLTFSTNLAAEAENIPYNSGIKFNELIEKLQEFDNKYINIYNEDIDEVWEIFTNQFKLIQAAGGIVRNKKEEVLFIYRLGKWDLPKGKVEKNEPIEKAAIREVEEECGLNSLKLGKFIISTYHVYFYKELILKETFWYEIFSENDMELTPQIEEDITYVGWKTINEIDDLMIDSYPNIQLLFNNYLNQL